MTKKRCIACEESRNEEQFKHDGLAEFCKGCWKGDTESENYRYRAIFYAYAKELFAMRFPEPKFDIINSVSIPDSKEAKKTMAKNIETNINNGLRHYRDKEEELRKNDGCSEQIQETCSNAAQLNTYSWRASGLVKKYS